MMRLGLRDIISYTFQDWLEDEAFRLSASFAYYAVFSLSPALIIVLVIANVVYSGNTEGQIEAFASKIVDPNAAKMIAQVATAAAQHASGGGIPALIGIAFTLVGATAAFAELQQAMNTVWELKSEAAAVSELLRTRILGFLMLIGISLLLLAVMALSAGIAVYQTYISGLPGAAFLFSHAGSAISFAVLVVVFAVLFRFLPDAHIYWRDVWIGALLTAALFLAGKLGISYYIGHAGFSSIYGAAGAILALLAWIYYSALIFFLGAEFTQVWADARGRRVVPKPYAISKPHRDFHHAPVEEPALRRRAA
jgi:membrane protein